MRAPLRDPPRPTWRHGAPLRPPERGPGRLEASCGASEPSRPRPQHDGPRALRHQVLPLYTYYTYLFTHQVLLSLACPVASLDVRLVLDAVAQVPIHTTILLYYSTILLC